ncbi:hypothetical protein ADK70_22680 [Streptomyces rimosus subsp. pseudoverticillatus]|nr:hypothetical protein ADK70_22680 [Streptomyces rimosus subsp. pseudoverticillatus]
MSSAIASGDGLKQRRTFSGFLCRDFTMSIKSDEPRSPRWVREECLGSAEVACGELVSSLSRSASGTAFAMMGTTRVAFQPC